MFGVDLGRLTTEREEMVGALGDIHPSYHNDRPASIPPAPAWAVQDLTARTFPQRNIFNQRFRKKQLGSSQGYVHRLESQPAVP